MLHRSSLIRQSSHHSLAVITLGVLALTACGGSEAKTGVPTLSKDQKGASSDDATKKTSTASFRTQLLAYAKCMRDNGVDFPDPQFDSNGRPQSNRADRQAGQGFAGLRDNPAFERARTACNDKRPDFAGHFQPTPAQQAETRTALLKFAKCMREKGIDFPDPTFDANGRPQFSRDSGPNGVQGQNRDDTAAPTARQACQKDIGGAFGGGGATANSN